MGESGSSGSQESVLPTRLLSPSYCFMISGHDLHDLRIHNFLCDSMPFSHNVGPRYVGTGGQYNKISPNEQGIDTEVSCTIKMCALESAF